MIPYIFRVAGAQRWKERLASLSSGSGPGCLQGVYLALNIKAASRPYGLSVFHFLHFLFRQWRTQLKGTHIRSPADYYKYIKEIIDLSECWVRIWLGCIACSLWCEKDVGVYTNLAGDKGWWIILLFYILQPTTWYSPASDLTKLSFCLRLELLLPAISTSRREFLQSNLKLEFGYPYTFGKHRHRLFFFLYLLGREIMVKLYR